MSIVGTVPSGIVNLIQERAMERAYHDPLFPGLKYRDEVIPSLWASRMGEEQIFTRTGLIDTDVGALTPGTDPSEGSYQTEQWRVIASQYSKTITTAMQQDRAAIASTFLRNGQTLGLNAAQTLNRIVRNRLFSAYAGGNTTVATAALINATQVHVQSLAGFTELTTSSGRLVNVSASNPLAITFETGAPAANTVIGVVPDNAAFPNGPGMLLLGSALSAAAAARLGVYASNRSQQINVGGGATVDDITAGNILTLTDILNAIARLRQMAVPTHGDGLYHVHVDPKAEVQLFNDAQFQSIFRGRGVTEEKVYESAEIQTLLGCRFIRNEESPSVRTAGTTGGVSNTQVLASATVDRAIGIDVVNANGLALNRTIVTGAESVIEKYIDESDFMTIAGVTGKIGNFSVTNNGLLITIERVRFIIRAPIDLLQQIVNQTWSWTGDYGVPSDQTSGGDPARYKRCVVITHA